MLIWGEPAGEAEFALKCIVLLYSPAYSRAPLRASSEAGAVGYIVLVCSSQLLNRTFFFYALSCMLTSLFNPWNYPFNAWFHCLTLYRQEHPAGQRWRPLRDMASQHQRQNSHPGPRTRTGPCSELFAHFLNSHCSKSPSLMFKTW